MKKHILIFIACFLLSANLQAQHFWIPDAVMRTLLKAAVPNCFTAQDSLIIANAHTAPLTYLLLTNSGINTISGIEFFEGVVTLNVTQNNLTTIDTLPKSLTKLYCSNNSLTSLPALWPPNLTLVDCRYNQITSFFSLPPNLTHLKCRYNQLSSLPVLPASIDTIDCGFNQLSSLPVLPLNLRLLDCSYCNITGLTFLSDSLRELNCEHNSISFIDSFPGNLVYLILDYNPLSSLPRLPQSLRGLSCNQCNLNSLDSLPGNIVALSLDYNHLTRLPGLPLSLVTLSCNHNEISYIPNFPANLDEFDCSHNQLHSLPQLTGNNQVYRFICGDNPLYCLPRLPNSIAGLFYENTFLTCLPNIPNSIFDPTDPWDCNPPSPVICPMSVNCYENLTQGFVYIDSNLNGMMDTGEGVKTLLVYSTSGTAVITGSDGFFTLTSDTGTVTFQVNAPYFTITPGVQTIHVSQNNTITIYFRLVPSATSVQDLSIDITPHFGFRPGFKVLNKIHYRNTGNQTIMNAVVKYVMTPLLTNLSSTPVLSGSVGDTIYWNIGQLRPYDEGSISILDSVSTAASQGNIIRPFVLIEPIAGDTTPLNNRCSSAIKVTQSYDPNGKTVNPEFIDSNFSDYLEYVIRFQNTGTDTAFSIVVTDTLSASLDLTSIETISSSNNYTFEMRNGIARWYFSNILLPDSNVNEVASHGFIKFKIKPISNLASGMQIQNKGNIYFDYNAAVITNTAVVDVTPLAVKPIASERVGIYPNPVHSSVYLSRSDNKALGKVQLLDENGKQIESSYILTSSFNWNVEQLPNGVYLFKGDSWTEKIIKK